MEEGEPMIAPSAKDIRKVTELTEQLPSSLLKTRLLDAVEELTAPAPSKYLHPAFAGMDADIARFNRAAAQALGRA